MTDSQLSDHDLLVRLDERVETILTWTKTHDYTHAVLREEIDKTDTETRGYRLKESQRIESVETKFGILGAGIVMLTGGIVAIVVALVTGLLT